MLEEAVVFLGDAGQWIDLLVAALQHEIVSAFSIPQGDRCSTHASQALPAMSTSNRLVPAHVRENQQQINGNLTLGRVLSPDSAARMRP